MHPNSFPDIERAPFGVLADGRPVTCFTLKNASGMTLGIMDFGAIITQLHAPDRQGRMADIVLGFDTLEPYVEASPYFGAVVGRYANRIRDGRFTLDGKMVQLPLNNGAHHLHGGPRGFDKVLWDAEPFSSGDTRGLLLRYHSADGEQGYPGNVEASVRYTLGDDNALLMEIGATTDAATPINLTQHTYFNLAGGGDILGHLLQINAQQYTPVDAGAIPLGPPVPVAGTPFDFRTLRPVGHDIASGEEQLRHGGGYDHNFLLADASRGGLQLAAVLVDPGSGRRLELSTEEPGLQFYSGNFLDGSLSGKGRTYAHRSGLCLEPQHFPDSPNRPDFPNTILRPGQTYATRSRYVFSAH